MKAVVVPAPMEFERVFVAEIPDPVPGRGEVVIDVAAVDTNYPDFLVIEGKYQFRPPPPFSPGKAAAGRIAALGAGVGGFAIGDHVAV